MAVQGPITRTIRDARLALSVMPSRDDGDPRWADVPLLDRKVPKRIALVPHVPGTPNNLVVAEVVREAGRRLAAPGYAVDEVLSLDDGMRSMRSTIASWYSKLSARCEA